ncbi:MAG TPA: helix-turn-helix domain-containing protein [Patescibacteria group bacterium]
MAAHGFQQKTVTPAESLGVRLKSLRMKKKLTLSQAEQETKVRVHYLEAIEDDRFKDLPSSHCKGFIRRYAAYLGLSSEVTEQSLATLYLDISRHPFSPRMAGRESLVSVTPKLLAVGFSIVVLLAFIGYVTYQVRQFASPPSLEITSPNNDQVVESETVRIEGKTEPGALVMIDDIQASVGSDGVFSYVLILRPGLNQITVVSENRIKKQTSRIVSILYRAPVSVSPVPSVSPSPSVQ